MHLWVTVFLTDYKIANSAGNQACLGVSHGILGTRLPPVICIKLLHRPTFQRPTQAYNVGLPTTACAWANLRFRDIPSTWSPWHLKTDHRIAGAATGTRPGVEHVTRCWLWDILMTKNMWQTDRQTDHSKHRACTGLQSAALSRS